MLRSRTRWEFKQVDEQEIDLLAAKAKIHPLIARLCWLRGIKTADEIDQFLHIESNAFHDPFMMKGMQESVERIQSALANNEQILIYGDYDADGVSSTTIMHYLLTHLGARFTYYIPDRFSEGYGLHKEAIENAAHTGVSLIITVDTGISAYHEVEYAKELGLDIIITDHHEPPEKLPLAYAVINPKQMDCTYPFSYLCGAGVAIKLAQALMGEVPEEWLGIAAIGTIADVVPLVDENRLIAYLGLRALTHSKQVGVRALLKESGIEGEVLTSFHVGFGIGPRINAGGRLERADIGVRLLTTESQEEAIGFAKRLNQLNQERQEIVKNIYEEAEKQAIYWQNQGLDYILIVAGEEWNEGIIGIVASRLVEKFNRPAIVLSIDQEKGMAKGSARSIEGFDLYINLTECKDLLVKYGGHTLAAGLSIKIEEIELFRNRMNTLARHQLTADYLQPKSVIELNCKLKDITLTFVEQIAKLAPFGASNPEPIIIVNDVEVTSMRKVGRDGEHIKWSFQQDEQRLDAIGFRFGEVEELISPHARLQVIGELSINEWNGVRKPQLMVKDLAINHLQIFDHRGTQNRLVQLNRLPQRGRTAILYFRPENRLNLEEFVKEMNFSLLPYLSDGEGLGEHTNEQFKDITQVVIFDLPTTFSSLQVFKQLSHVERVWCLFGVEMNEKKLTKIPSRDMFKWFYSYLYTYKTVAIDNKIWEIGKRKGLSEHEQQFMIQVFKDLDFIRESEGYISIIENPQKQSFEQSLTYQKEKERIDVETELVFSSVQELSKWILRSTKNGKEIKEAIVQ